MNTEQFRELLDEFTLAAESGDGERFARSFCEDGVYYDYIYGPHKGRKSIAHMMGELFHRDADKDYRWEMFDPICVGNIGYAWSLSSYTSVMPEFKGNFVVIDGMSRFVLRDNLIAEYHECVNGGVSMTQLGVDPVRQNKVFARWIKWLKERPSTQSYLSRPVGWRQERLRLSLDLHEE